MTHEIQYPIVSNPTTNAAIARNLTHAASAIIDAMAWLQTADMVATVERLFDAQHIITTQLQNLGQKG